jgi:hypothetical protein
LPVVDDAEKEEAEETGAPEHDEAGVDDLTSMVVAGESKGYHGKESEICAPCEVWKGPGASKGCHPYFVSIFGGENGEFRTYQ